MHYATATAARLHGDLCVEDNVPGVAVKQKVVGAGVAAGAANQQAIAVTEPFAIISKGIVQIYNTVTGRSGGAALNALKGSTLYATIASGASPTTPALALAGPASATLAKIGRVVEVGPARGTPTGMIRVDLDKKDSFV
jgi:hypothetical protein